MRNFKILHTGDSFSNRGTTMYDELIQKDYGYFMDEDEGGYYHNVAMTSAGNTYIVNSVIENMKKYKYDYVLIQLSALIRPFVDNFPIKFQLEAPFDYIINHESFLAESIVPKNIINYNLEIILSLQEKLISDKIPHKFYWGWEQLYDAEIKQDEKSKLTLDKIIENGTMWFHEYDEGFYDKFHYLTCTPSARDKFLNFFKGESLPDNWYPASKYGGTLEFIRDEIGDMGFEYDPITNPEQQHALFPGYDNHPNKIGQAVFYEKVMKRWLRELFYES